MTSRGVPNNDNGRKPAKKRSHWLLWWKIDPDELQREVREYHAHHWTAARNIATYCLLLTTAVVVIFINAGWLGFDPYNYLDAGAAAILAVFVFFGHRWAMIAAMLFWTLERGIAIVDLIQPGQRPQGGVFISQIIWWTVYMHAFWLAFRVEQVRRNSKAHLQSDEDRSHRLASTDGLQSNAQQQHEPAQRRSAARSARLRAWAEREQAEGKEQRAEYLRGAADSMDGRVPKVEFSSSEAEEAYVAGYNAGPVFNPLGLLPF